MNELFEQLNDAQSDAVRYNDGPSLVIAGAGAGKTRVLTYKIAYLLQNGYKPWNILALTFTNKAADEMKERIAGLVGEDLARKLVMGTFHSVFSRILRIEAESIGFTSQYTIYDESDSCSLLKSIIKERNLNDKVYKPSVVHKHISLAKNNLCMPADYADDTAYRERDDRMGLQDIHEIYDIYDKRLKQANAMDFDDILLYTHILFRCHPEICARYAEKYHYILVDEYQDTNNVQQDIVRALATSHARVCAVGDDAQSIYGFRGANIYNVLRFENTFSDITPDSPRVRLFKLEQNYRSTKNIVNAANSLISHNKHQIQKEIYSHNGEGEKIRVKECYSDKEEAIVVANEIKRRKKREGMKYSDFAVLYRTNVQSRVIEEQLRKDMIAYRIVGGLSFYQHKEIKDIIAYIRLIINHNDEEALKRIINYPARGIGKTTLDKIYARAVEHGVAPWEVVSKPEEHGLPVSKAALNKLLTFVEMIDYFTERRTDVDAATLVKDLLEKSKINEDIFGKNDFEDVRRQENVQEFMNGIKDFVDSRTEEEGENAVYIADFLQEVSLMTDLDSEEATDDRVTLMTVHSAKGLEFPAVFVVGLEENIFPSEKSRDIPSALEEERRLLYVAITRAEKYCMLTSAQRRSRFGEIVNNERSRFIKDIDRAYVEREEAGNGGYNGRSWNDNVFDMPEEDFFRKPSAFGNRYGGTSSRRYDNTPPSRNLRRLTPSAATVPPPSDNVARKGQPSSAENYGGLTKGCRVEHERFGMGRVVELEGTGESSKAKVEFDNGTVKMLLLKFARMKKI